MQYQELLEQFKSNGKKLTKVRKNVLKLLFDTEHPISAPELLERLSSNKITINKTTLYRELTFLLEQNVITEVTLNTQVQHYELKHLDHHHHLVCSDCGDISKIEADEIEKSIKKLESTVKRNGFFIQNHQLEFFGVCSKCH